MRTSGGRSESSETSNVVRIPRDWFGPKDELVPFGPRAWEEPGPDEPSAVSGDPAAAEPVDANLFWGEDAGTVHGVLDPPAGGIASADRRTRPLVAAALVGVIASVGIAFGLLGGSTHHPPHPAPTLANRADIAPSPRGLLRLMAGATTQRPARARSAKTGPGSSTPGLSRSNQNPPPTRVSYSPSRSSSASAAGNSAVLSSTSAAAASAPTTTHSSQPAFGSSGALGPMSSPDG